MNKVFMPKLLLFLTLFTAICLNANLTHGQVVTQQQAVRHEMRIDETTPIYNKATGEKIPMKEFNRMVRESPNENHLEASYDEFGHVSSYTLRPYTAEEKQTHRVSDLNEDARPKVGEAMPLFVMKGIDDKIYRSTDLKGQIVILGFWINMKKPFWEPAKVKELGNILKPYQSYIISLGVLDISKSEIQQDSASATLPFVAIPDSFGFNKKFQIATVPSFIVIDKAGNVAAYIEGFENEELKKVLTTVSK